MNPKAYSSVFIPLLIGIVALSQSLSRPRLQDLRTVEILPLLAAGVCFGVALSHAFRVARDSRRNR